jgi:hypothetical protein
MVRVEILNGPWHAAGNGLLRRRKVLAKVKENEWVTHIETKAGLLMGHYFSSFDAALDDFERRMV